MIVDVVTSTDKYDYRDRLEIYIDGECVVSFYDGEPEDNSLARNFSSVYSIQDIIADVHQAGTNREPLIIREHEIDWGHDFEFKP